MQTTLPFRSSRPSPRARSGLIVPAAHAEGVGTPPCDRGPVPTKANPPASTRPARPVDESTPHDALLALDIETVVDRPHLPRAVAPFPALRLARLADGRLGAGVLASDLEDVLQSWGAPTLWVHGNVPRRVDHVIDRTRVVANPRGGPGLGFDHALVVEA